jgi:hypothetical protein
VGVGASLIGRFEISDPTHREGCASLNRLFGHTLRVALAAPGENGREEPYVAAGDGWALARARLPGTSRRIPTGENFVTLSWMQLAAAIATSVHELLTWLWPGA